MTDRPILMSAPMVLACLREADEPDTGKTQTRRIINPQPPEGARYSGVHYASDEPASWFFNTPRGPFKVRERFESGDRLWVRETLKRDSETWRYAADGMAIGMSPRDQRVPAMLSWAHHKDGDTCVSIHMPRWASRLTLTVTDVRVQRLQDITEAEAIAEGATSRPRCTGYNNLDDGWCMDWSRVGKASKWAEDGKTLTERDIALVTAVHAFGNHWDTIHGAGAWKRNDWVIVLTFTVERRNIDSPSPKQRPADGSLRSRG